MHFIQFVRIAIFMSLHVPAGACIPVASVSPIHVFPIRVLKHCGAHKQILGHSSWRAGFTHQLGYKNSARQNTVYNKLQN